MPGKIYGPKERPPGDNVVFERAEGFYCIVRGREHGAWIDKAKAEGGLDIEKRRAEKRRNMGTRSGNIRASHW